MKEVKRVNRRDQECIVFHHDTFPNQEIYCVEKFCKVEEEGAAVDFFDGDSTVEDLIVQDDENGEELSQNFENLQATDEDIAMFSSPLSLIKEGTLQILKLEPFYYSIFNCKST